jgi:hypothetical protein
MDLMLWNVALTGVLALVSWFAKTMWAEQQRLNILLNRTREEVARDYVTKTEVHADINRVIQRLEQLDAKLDRLMERKGETMDPASVTLAIGAATKAFSMLKRGFEIGRDIESMHGDIQKWMGASAQIAAIEKTTKNPSVITRLLTGSDNIEAMATQAVLARKQLEQQRYD